MKKGGKELWKTQKEEKTERERRDKYCVRHHWVTGLLQTDKDATAWSVRDRLTIQERDKVWK